MRSHRPASLQATQNQFSACNHVTRYEAVRQTTRSISASVCLWRVQAPRWTCAKSRFNVRQRSATTTALDLWLVAPPTASSRWKRVAAWLITKPAADPDSGAERDRPASSEIANLNLHSSDSGAIATTPQPLDGVSDACPEGKYAAWTYVALIYAEAEPTTYATGRNECAVRGRRASRRLIARKINRCIRSNVQQGRIALEPDRQLREDDFAAGRRFDACVSAALSVADKWPPSRNASGRS